MSHAQEAWSEACREQCSPVNNNLQVLSSQLSKGQENSLLSLSLMHAYANAQAQIDHWGEIFRFVRDGRPRGSAIGLAHEWEMMQKEALAFTEICAESAIAKRQRDICITGCSASRLLEANTRISELEKVKLTLMTQSPWIMSDQMLSHCQRAEENETYRPSPAQIRETFMDSMVRFFADLQKYKTELFALEQELQSNPTPPSSWSKMKLLEHDLALQSLLVSSAHRYPALCGLAAHKAEFNRYRRNLSIGIDVSLFALGLIMGPEVALLKLGIKSKALMRAARFLPEGGITGKYFFERAQNLEQCQRTQTQAFQQERTAQEVQACLREQEQANIEAALQTLSLGSLNGLRSLREVSRSWARSTDQLYLRSARNELGHVSHLDLSNHAALQRLGVDQVSGEYWNFVAGIYRQRLNLSEAEIKSFVRSSREFESRTHLVIQSQNLPRNGSTQFQGGVAIVSSRKASELLPFEKATGVRVSREQGQIAEIVRLTSAKNDATELMGGLLKEIGAVLQAQPGIKDIYVYTSKIHSRLYRKLGIKHEIQELDNSRDVLIKIDPRDYLNGVAR